MPLLEQSASRSMAPIVACQEAIRSMLSSLWTRPSPAVADADAVRRAGRMPEWATGLGAFGALFVQLLVGLQGIANYWQWGHNGFNNAAYLLAAKNSLRWGILLPAQYASGNHPPQPNELYTHAPLGLHLHNVASVWLLGDHEVSIRIVPVIYGLLAALMVFLIARRHWSALHGVVATWVYVLLPINTAYANMTNHDTGCITWTLAMLYGYLEWIRKVPSTTGAPPTRRSAWWVVVIFVAAFMALNWNWPAYYFVFLMAWHWLYVSFDAGHRRLPHRFGLNREHVLIAVFSVFVVANLVGFFLLVEHLVGSFSEMSGSFNLRASAPTDAYSRIWAESWEPLFSVPALLMGGLWAVGLVWRHARGDVRAAELVPFGFAFAGVAHTVLFKQTVLVHIYWPWQLNPFLGLASAIVILWAVRGLERVAERVHVAARGELMGPWLRRVVVMVALAGTLGPFAWRYLAHVLPMIPEGRRVAGTYHYPGYQTEYLKVLFAHKVHDWTTFDTGVLLLRNVPHRVEFIEPLDRVRGWAARPDRITPPRLEGAGDGWVVVGDARTTPRDQVIAAAAEHPFRQYGLYFMVDHRTRGQNIAIWNLTPDAPSPWWWWFFVNAYEPPMRAERDAVAEDRLRKAVADHLARKLSPPPVARPRVSPTEPVFKNGKLDTIRLRDKLPQPPRVELPGPDAVDDVRPRRAPRRAASRVRRKADVPR